MILVNKRTQVAMEFLMTYGWALLVVLIVISALAFFGLLSPDRFLPDKVDLGPGLSVSVAVIDEAFINIYVNNGMGKVLNDFQINATECSDSGILSSPKQLVSGKTTRITIPCNGQTVNKKFNTNLKINYTTTTKGYTLFHAREGEFRMTAVENCRMDGLVGAWLFENDYDDCSGNSNHGIPKKDVDLFTNLGNTVLRLNQNTWESMIILPTMYSFTVNDAWSVAAWLNWDYIGVNTPAWLGDNVRKYDEYLCMAGGEFRFRERSPDYKYILLGNSNSYKDAGWFHIVITYEPYGNGYGTMRSYINGNIYDTELNVEGSIDINNIGHGNYNSAGQDGGFNGLIDKVFIFNRLLSGIEIKSIYSSGK